MLNGIAVGHQRRHAAGQGSTAYDRAGGDFIEVNIVAADEHGLWAGWTYARSCTALAKALNNSC
jgi:hypothetical protein